MTLSTGVAAISLYTYWQKPVNATAQSYKWRRKQKNFEPLRKERKIPLSYQLLCSRLTKRVFEWKPCPISGTLTSLQLRRDAARTSVPARTTGYCKGTGSQTCYWRGIGEPKGDDEREISTYRSLGQRDRGLQNFGAIGLDCFWWIQKKYHKEVGGGRTGQRRI